MNNFSILSRRTKIIFAILIVLLLIGAAFSLFTPGRAAVGERGPDQRPSEWDWQRRTFPYGKADDDAHLVAVRQAQQMRLDQRFKNDGILSAAQWEQMGPTNIGGRITDIEFNPKNPAIVYAAAASGGIFKSLDTGNSWQPVFDEQAVFSMGDIAVDPVNPEIIYVGTGEANAQHNAFPGGGVFKTTNGGKSWQNMGLVGTVAIGRVVVDPQDPQRVFVAALGSGFAYNSNRGLFRSDDGGKTWAKKLYINDSTGVIDVVVNPNNPNIVYASVWERNRRIDYRHQFGMASGLFKSADGGDTWEKLDEANGLPNADSIPIGRIGLAISSSAPDVVYASYTNGYEYIGLFKTKNGGQSWDSTEAVPTSHGFSWYFGQVRVRPDNSDVVYVLDTDFLRSSNGGTSWDLTLGYEQEEIHVDHHALAFHPQNHDYIISGNDGGMNISQDGGATWRKVMNLPITQFYEISLDAQNPQKIYGGTQDNNTIRTQTGSRDDWEAILGGDGFYSIVDPTDTNIIYAEYQNGMLLKSIDGGIFFFDTRMGIPDSEARNWSTPVVMDPQDSRTLYYGAEHIYKTTDGADNWTAISPPLSPVESYLYGTISTIAIAPSNRKYIYAGTDDGHLWVTTDGGNSWNEITNGTPQRWVTRIAVDPNDPEVAYATYSGLKWRDDVPHVFKTMNAGESWQNISANLPQAPVNAFAIDPFKTNILYLGSDVGAFVSFNSGDSWSVLGEGMPITSVYDMKIHPKEHFLVAGTHGRSAYKINLDNVISSVNDDKSFKENLKFACSPNPFKNETWISGQMPRAGKVQVKIFDSQGREIRTFPVENLDAGEFSRMWDAKDGSGKYVASGAYMAQILYYFNGTLYAETQKVLKIT